MENDVLDAIKDLDYQGPMLGKEYFAKAVAGGPKNIEFTVFVNYVTNELRVLCSMDEQVNPIIAPEDSATFLLELSSFLKELGCPFTSLTQGYMSDRLSTEQDRILLLDYLLSELMAVYMLAANKPDSKIELKLQETSTAADLKRLLVALSFNKPPPNITPQLLFQKVETKLKDVAKRAGPDLTGKPIFTGYLSEKQWDTLIDVEKKLHHEYALRREMLLKRLDVTVQSFQWSDKVKGKEDQIVQTFHNKRKLLKVNPEVDLSDLLAARDDLAIIEKTSSVSVRKNTQSSVNKVIIGSVPDRGGRPSEQAPPPPEMPSWQQNRSTGSGGGRGGGRGGGNQFRDRSGGDFQGGGQYSGYQQGGYNQGYQQQGYQQGGSYQQGYQGRGGYQQDRGYQPNNYGGRGGGRSYDSYRPNKMTYAEQYVQEAQQNRQYSGRDSRDQSGYQRGRSNYNRGGYR